MTEVETKSQTTTLAMDSAKPEVTDLDFEIKHPLTTSWTLFYLDPDEAKKFGWTAGNKEVLSFNTVEDFWALYHHTTLLSQLKKGSDYSLFRGGLDDMEKIRPEWEDKQNRPGGQWKIALDNRAVGNKIDDIFRELLMICVGENFGDFGEYVNGVVASARGKQYRLGIWTKDDVRDHCQVIGEKILEILPSGLNIQMEFITHSETERASKGRGIDPRPMMSLSKK
ncbi:putative Eukaryotic translation initiation factor 4E [Hypsibius exemplaris]|uniref:Eukaryotic translation initiation factor 4E n=1 Tax=Hypsibius exemplaris TaxID=2072580 RepID=A0A1W0XB55_HYPEX|nr:putative Eukaryotic translation initiation factor 4E [Hypsibius exemplaris]